MVKGSGRDKKYTSVLLVQKLLLAGYSINKFEVLLRCRGSTWSRPRALINLEWANEWEPNARNMFVPTLK